MIHNEYQKDPKIKTVFMGVCVSVWVCEDGVYLGSEENLEETSAELIRLGSSAKYTTRGKHVQVYCNLKEPIHRFERNRWLHSPCYVLRFPSRNGNVSHS